VTPSTQIPEGMLYYVAIGSVPAWSVHFVIRVISSVHFLIRVISEYKTEYLQQVIGRSYFYLFSLCRVTRRNADIVSYCFEVYDHVCFFYICTISIFIFVVVFFIFL
jgi:hypothetical protein